MNKSISNFALFTIIINSVLGGSVFINVPQLSVYFGSFSFLVYFAGLLILSPILYCIGSLSSLQEVEGNMFRIISNHTNNIVAGMAVWSYFIGRTVSMVILSKTLAENVLSSVELQSDLNTYLMVFKVFLLFTLMRMLGVSGTGFSRKIFVFFKIVPIFIVMSICFWNFQTAVLNFVQDFLLLKSNFLKIIPLGVFPLSGFTVLIYVADELYHPSSSKKILFWGMLAVTVISSLFQLGMFSLLGCSSMGYSGELFCKIIGTNDPSIHMFFKNIISLVVFSSCFMILIGNPKNLYLLAKANLLPFKHFFTWTCFQVPLGALAVSMTLGLTLLITSKNTVSLVPVAVITTFFWYLASAVAAFVYFLKTDKTRIVIPILGMASCFLSIFACARMMIETGVSLSFITIFTTGILTIFYKATLEKRFH